MPKRAGGKVAQAWIELKADDPEAMSALAVARAHLPAGARLTGLRRVRLMEITGALPGREQVESLLHHSTQFYNPHKERCTLRVAEGDPSPFEPEGRVVLVVDREGARRGAAERWWKHETGESVEVREGTAWVMRLATPQTGDLEELTLVRGRRHGLLCNPHSQDCRLADGAVPVPWLQLPASPKRSGR